MYPDIETLKTLLLSENFISATDSDAVEAAAEGDSNAYVAHLFKAEVLSPSLLGQALAENYGVPYVDLEALPVSKEKIARIPEEIARTQRVVYLRESNTIVAIVTDNPNKIDLAPLQPIFSGKKIRFGYALPTSIDACFALYEQPLPTKFAEIIESGKSVAPEIVDEIIRDALRLKTSDIHFEPGPKGVQVRFRVDGSLREAGQVPRQYYENILNRIKVESGMRIDEHFSAQDGSIQYEGDGQHADLRVSLIPTVQGEKVVMRVLGSYVESFSLNDVGMSNSQQAMLKEYAAKPFGMILTVGPTGSGKTTTLYALLKLLNKPDVNITTIEDPVEYKLAGVNQIQIQEETNMTFSRGLRAIVRQDPDIILVGEIRDRETAEISVNAALTGHLLLSTFHANDAATALPRLLDMGIEPFLLASTLEVVIAQRLVRKTCPQCRYSIAASEVLQALGPLGDRIAHNFEADDTIYASKGCANCNGTGYKGRVALYEFVEMTPEMQSLLLTSPSTQEIEKLARAHGSRAMFDEGIEKVKAGQTTLEELLRVVVPPITLIQEPSATEAETPVKKPATKAPKKTKATKISIKKT